MRSGKIARGITIDGGLMWMTTTTRAHARHTVLFFGSMALLPLTGCGGSASDLASCVADPSCDVFAGEWLSDDSGRARTYVRVSAGSEHTCALDDTGEAVCFGSNVHSASTPPEGGTFVQPFDKRFVDLAAGGANNCALDDGGAIVCWGYYALIPPATPNGSFVQIDWSGSRGCVRDDAGAITCWAIPGEENHEPPTGGFVDVAVGRRHGCALDDAGHVTCWGDVPGGRNPVDDQVFTQLDARMDITCGVRADGALQCFGYEDDDSPLLSPPEGTFTRVAVGDSNVCALDENGLIMCYGAEYNMLHMSPDEPFVDVTVGGGHACGLRADGTLRCWGKNDDGQLDVP
jgi:alpha-tubulin suppressor-like RCC1 family protein